MDIKVDAKFERYTVVGLAETTGLNKERIIRIIRDADLSAEKSAHGPTFVYGEFVEAVGEFNRKTDEATLMVAKSAITPAINDAIEDSMAKAIKSFETSAFRMHSSLVETCHKLGFQAAALQETTLQIARMLSLINLKEVIVDSTLPTAGAKGATKSIGVDDDVEASVAKSAQTKAVASEKRPKDWREDTSDNFQKLVSPDVRLSVSQLKALQENLMFLERFMMFSKTEIADLPETDVKKINSILAEFDVSGCPRVTSLNAGLPDIVTWMETKVETVPALCLYLALAKQRIPRFDLTTFIQYVGDSFGLA